jgi:hypothetical protein
MAQANQPRVVTELARATGVSAQDVAKVLNQLGLDRIQAEALRAHNGQEPGAAEAKIAFRIGKSTIVV